MIIKPKRPREYVRRQTQTPRRATERERMTLRDIGGREVPKEYRNVNPMFLAHMDFGGRGSLPESHNSVHVQNLSFASNALPHHIRTGKQKVAALRGDGADWNSHLSIDGMHRGEGMSSWMLQSDGYGASSGFAAMSFAGMQGMQDVKVDQSKWATAAPSAGATKSAASTNPLLEEDHLRLLLGDMNSDLMMKVQRAGAALEKLWKVVDVDNDGYANYYEVKNVFAKWSNALSQDSDAYISDSEKTMESTINYKRFIEIFLPLTLTVPHDQILARVSSRFATAGRLRSMLTQAEEAGGLDGMNNNPLISPRRQRGRRTLLGASALGLDGHNLNEFVDGGLAGATGLARDNTRKNSLQRKKTGDVNVPDLSIGFGQSEPQKGRSSVRSAGGARSSRGRATVRSESAFNPADFTSRSLQRSSTKEMSSSLQRSATKEMSSSVRRPSVEMNFVNTTRPSTTRTG